MPNKLVDLPDAPRSRRTPERFDATSISLSVAGERQLLNLTRELAIAKTKLAAYFVSRGSRLSITSKLKSTLSRAASFRSTPPKPGLFNRQWYLERYPDVAETRQDPWLHYLKYGVKEGRFANAWFDTQWYMLRYPDVAATGLNPLIHYVKYGAYEGRDPNPLFSTNWYLTRYPDVEKGGFNPLHHFLLHGAAEGRLCHPRMKPDSTEQSREEMAYIASLGVDPLFNSQWYLNTYADVRLSGIDAWSHYFWDGAREGRNPNPVFDTKWYRDTHPTVDVLGVNPLIHFVEIGSDLGFDPHPSFKCEYYQAKYPDVKASGLNPLLHFLAYGIKEARITFPDFDTDWYASMYPETISAGFSPIEHYLLHGRNEGRQAFEGDNTTITPISHVYVGYQPGPTIEDNGLYLLSDVPQKYSYVAPRAPVDLAAFLNGLSKQIKFSIVVPVYNTPSGLLELLFQSVSRQWYSDWELILVDDCSTDEGISPRLFDLCAKDKRVTFVKAEQNGGIANSTNIGVDAATGEYIVFLDHDDELTPDCLFELAKRVETEDPDFIYSDEDKLDENGAYTQPFFKPDWSPDTFMNTMYTCHVSCIRRSLIREVGGLRAEYDGCQDWDLVLRVTEKTTRIAHVPKVLYHWRIIPNSVAASLSAKPYAIENSRLARQEALRRRGVAGDVLPVKTLPGHFNVKYDLKEGTLVSIVIPTKNNCQILKSCIQSIETKTSYDLYEIIIVDNGSTDPDAIEYLKSLSGMPKISVATFDIEFNYSRLNNFGASKASGDVIVFLNDDTEVTQGDWLASLAAFALLPHVGAVGAKLLYPNATAIQHNGILNLMSGPCHAFMGMPPLSEGYFARNMLDCNWLAVTGACLAIETQKFRDIGQFDEEFPVAYNDVELCFRLFKSGFFNASCSSIELIHHESISRGVDHLVQEKRERLERERMALYTRHPDLYMYDPFHNPNLHPDDPNFKLSNRWLGEI